MEKSYSVLACKPDYSFAVLIFSSPDMNACVSVATTCYQNSKVSCFKIVDEFDNTLVSYIRQDFPSSYSSTNKVKS